MRIDDTALIAALRGSQSVEEVCRVAGATAAEFASARDDFLRRRATLTDRSITGAVGGAVEILRDRAGIPHIYASSTADLYFGLGVATAEDRLWQIDRLRRRALGRQAEILGPTYAASDAAHLTVGIDLICDREASAVDEKTHAIVAAYVAGINRQIELYGALLPVEFQVLGYAPAPFSVRDVIAIARGFWWSLNGRIDRIVAAEAARLLPTPELRTLYLTPETSENLVLPWLSRPASEGAGAAPIAAGSDDATGSNNWALHGSRTGTGKAVLCGDPHQPFWVPSSWHEHALHGPEDDCAGAGPPGFPGLWWGSNGRIAWAITNNAASTRDLYREQVDPHDAKRYRDGDTWRAFDERRVTIPVRGEAARPLTIRSTVRGPVVNGLVPSIEQNGDPPLSLKWVGMEHLDDLRASIAIARAHDWAGFRNALRDWSVAVFNFVYADKDGHVGYQMAGRVPVRGRIVPGFRDANDAADRWQGYIPFEGLPHSFDPPRGYVASANQRIVPPEYPHPFYGAYSQGHRGIRIDQAFGGGGIADRAAAIALQNDVKNCRAERMCPHILRHLAGSRDADAVAVTAALKSWDGRYTLDSAVPTVFETFMNLWQRTVIGAHVPERLLDLTQQQTGLAMSLLEGVHPQYFAAGTSATVVAVAKQAMAELRSRLGNDQQGWQWGRIHKAHWHHPIANAAFDIGPESLDGGSHTVRNTGGEQPPHAASSGAEYRIVVDFAVPDSFVAVQNIGNSGVPGSPHYKDQFEPWVRGEYHTVQLRRDRIECESTTRIRPN
jgi:penicillin amidase